jgi:hypothetical protein
MSSEETICEEFSQWSQRCTICSSMLWDDEEIASDPRNKLHIVHKDCISLLGPKKERHGDKRKEK